MQNKYFSFLLIVLVMLLMVACNTPGTNAPDDTHVPDSMPVVIPEVKDTSGVITPPPTNDENVILPDSQIKI